MNRWWNLQLGRQNLGLLTLEVQALDFHRHHVLQHCHRSTSPQWATMLRLASWTARLCLIFPAD